MTDEQQTLKEAEKAGFGLSLVDASLRLTHEQRAREHDQALALVIELDRIRQLRDRNFDESAGAAR